MAKTNKILPRRRYACGWFAGIVYNSEGRLGDWLLTRGGDLEVSGSKLKTQRAGIWPTWDAALRVARRWQKKSDPKASMGPVFLQQASLETRERPQLKPWRESYGKKIFLEASRG